MYIYKDCPVLFSRMEDRRLSDVVNNESKRVLLEKPQNMFESKFKSYKLESFKHRSFHSPSFFSKLFFCCFSVPAISSWWNRVVYNKSLCKEKWKKYTIHHINFSNASSGHLFLLRKETTERRKEENKKVRKRLLNISLHPIFCGLSWPIYGKQGSSFLFPTKDKKKKGLGLDGTEDEIEF